MRRVILVRHGQSEANRAGMTMGYGDAVLTDLGRQQAAEAAAAVAAMNLDAGRLMSSRLRRAAATAEPIAARMGLVTVFDDRLRAGESMPKGIDLFAMDVRLGIGDEVLAALAEGLAASPGVLVAVTHRYPINALLSRLYDVPTADRVTGEVGNGDALELLLDGNRAAGPPRLHPLPA